MPRIDSYPTVTPTTSDLVVISDVSGTGNPTKTATIASITGVISDVAVPASDSSTGVAGQIAVSAYYIYLCTAANTWRRIQVTGSGW